IRQKCILHYQSSLSPATDSTKLLRFCTPSVANSLRHKIAPVENRSSYSKPFCRSQLRKRQGIIVAIDRSNEGTHNHCPTLQTNAPAAKDWARLRYGPRSRTSLTFRSRCARCWLWQRVHSAPPQGLAGSQCSRLRCDRRHGSPYQLSTLRRQTLSRT